MKNSIANLEDELFGMRIDNLLGAFEYSVQVRNANAAIELMLERIDAMVATGNVITDAGPGASHRASQRPAENRDRSGHGRHAGRTARSRC